MILTELLDCAFARKPVTTARLAPSRAPMGYYYTLRQQIAAAGSAMRRAIVGKQDTVAVVLPSDPIVDVAVVAAPPGAVCASVGPEHEPHHSDDELVAAIESLPPSRHFEPRPQCAPPTRTWE